MSLKQEPLEGPPSYLDSVDQDYTSSPGPRTYPISDQLAISRTTHLQSIINILILPLIHDRASQGLSLTNIALLPSNTFEATNSAKVLGLASVADEDVVQLQLEGSINRNEFWRQKAVMDELQRLLLDSLSSPSLTSLQNKSSKATPTSPVAASLSNDPVANLPSRPSKKPRGFFSRKSSSSPAVKDEGTWLHATNVNATMQQQIRVSVQLEDLCIRSMSEFGLYVTITRPAILVEVQISS